MIAQPMGQVWLWASYAERLQIEHPEYWRAFWTEPGHVGHDEPQHVGGDVIDSEAAVVRVLTPGEIVADERFRTPEFAQLRGMAALFGGMQGAAQLPMAVEVDHVPDGYRLGTGIKIVSGDAAGRQLYALVGVDNVFLCEASNTIMFDQDFAASLSSDPLLGDMSVGYLISDAYSDAIQVALRSRREGEPRALFSDCLTGAWTSSIVPPTPDDSVISLSAGDLDEAIVTAIIRGDPATDTNVNGSAFEKIDAFRLGVLGGLNECRTRLG